MASSSPQQELSQLQAAFHLFTESSRKLEVSYERLKRQAEGLKQELREKNARLVASLQEKERLEGFLNGVLQSAPAGILVTAPDGRIRLANPKARELLAADGEALEGRSCRDVEILEDLPLRFGTAREKQMGRSVYACSVSTLNGRPEDDAGWVIVIEDITSITRWKAIAERQKRLSSMGEMAARLAHEIRNPLGSMELNVSMLLEELEGTDEPYALACRLSSGVRTVTQVLSNLLHFAKGTDPQWQDLDLGRLVREAVEFSHPLLRDKGIRVQTACRGSGFRVRGDRVLLRQAVLNLILNGVDAMDPGGRLGIRVEAAEGTGAWEGRPMVRVCVEDNGKGIPEEDLDRIFDPFFSTKSRGTGLGLAIVNNIIERHQGVAEVESRMGEGSCFVLSLPCDHEEAADG